MRLAREEPLSGGSYLSHFYPSERDWRRKTNGVRVGVIDYRLDGVPDAEPIYRLVTTILDHNKAPAVELAALYHERWEIETALDELKTHLRGAKIVLRSRTPDLVRQEFYGLIMAHFAIRGLMHEAALKGRRRSRPTFFHPCSPRIERARKIRFIPTRVGNA
jgi:Transposase DDE domain